MGPLVAEMIDFRRSAMGTKRAVLPADCGQLIDRRLLVGKRGHHLNEIVELFNHGATLLL